MIQGSSLEERAGSLNIRSSSNSSGGMGLRILLVDDHPIVEHGLSAVLEPEADLHIIGRVSGSTDAIQWINHNPVDLLMLEVSVESGSDNFRLIRTVRDRFRKLKILVFSANPEEIYAERCLRAGAHGYLMKLASSDMIRRAIRQVISGSIFLSGRLRDRLLETLVQPGARSDMQRGGLTRLSNRELEVLEMLSKGYSNTEISSHLSISKKTVDAHKQSIRRKLQLPSSQRLAAFAASWQANEISAPLPLAQLSDAELVHS